MKARISGDWGILKRCAWPFAAATMLILSILAIVNAASASPSANPPVGAHLLGNGDVNFINSDGAQQGTPTPTPTACSSVVQNGGFETGALPPWTVLGTSPAPVVSTASTHSGTYAALLGTVTGPEPAGDSSIYQTITIPADGGILSYWWNGDTSDTITFDWQDAYVTSTSGTILDTIMHNCTVTGGFINVRYDLSQFRGQTIRIEFLVHQDGASDDTSMYVDDVELLTSCSTSTPSSSTNTPGVATSTPTPASTNVAGNTPTSGPASTNTPQPSFTPTVCTIQYTDVPSGYWAYGYIRCLACRGVVTGYADGTFRPENNLTRAQLAKIIANSVGWTDTIPPTRQTFTDVPPANPFWLYVERAYLHGVIGGYVCGGSGEPCPGIYFRPYNYVTRGQVAKIDTLAAGFIDSIPSTRQTFADVPPTNPFWLYVERAYLHGVIGGYVCGGSGEPCPGIYFRPSNNVTRAQISKIVYNSFFPGCQTPRKTDD